MCAKITKLTYRRLVTLGNYENHHLEATLELSDGDDAREMATHLRRWVNMQLHVPDPIDAQAHSQDSEAEGE